MNVRIPLSTIGSNIVNQLPPPSVPAPPGLPGMRGRLVLMATLAAVSVYGTVTGPLEASTAEPGTTTEVATVDTNADVAAPDTTTPDTTAPDTTTPDTTAPDTTAVAPTSNDPATPETSAPADDTDAGPITAAGPFTDGFDTEASHWRAVNGSWAVQNGTFVQSDPSGFDLINELMIELPEAYDISVRMRAVGDQLGGGVIVGMTTTASRRGAYLIDFTAGGAFLRWGRYDVDTGIYKYLGGLDVGADPGEWHTLRVAIAESESTVFFDGDPMGTFDAVVGGHAALVTSESSVEFDDVRIEVR